MRACVKRVCLGLAIGLIMSGAACSTVEPPTEKATASLYDRLGGKAGYHGGHR